MLCFRECSACSGSNEKELAKVISQAELYIHDDEEDTETEENEMSHSTSAPRSNKLPSASPPVTPRSSDLYVRGGVESEPEPEFELEMHAPASPSIESPPSSE